MRMLHYEQLQQGTTSFSEFYWMPFIFPIITEGLKIQEALFDTIYNFTENYCRKRLWISKDYMNISFLFHDFD